MKLTKTEIYAIVITLVFMALAIGFRVGGNERAPFAISTQNRDIPENVQTVNPRDDREKDGAAKLMVNINSASGEELQKLDGIGEKLAQRIIDYREENGPFRSIQDITNVSGIGSGVYDKIREHITVS